MFKTVIKEIIIVLLLIIAIVLILGVFLYDYIPTNKIIPKVEQYQVPENIKSELQENINANETQTIITYEIDQGDLKIYEKGKEYRKGKANPFEQYSNEQTNSTINNIGNGTSNNTAQNSTTSNINTVKNPDATGNYLDNTGTK